MAEDRYLKGEFCTFNGEIYEAVNDTAYSPADYAVDWKKHE